MQSFFLLNHLGYSVRKAATGSLFAAFLEGSNPPSIVRKTLSVISINAERTGRKALTSGLSVR